MTTMNEGQPSKTAEWVARQRAMHQVLDNSLLVLDDPFAVRILSEAQRSTLLLSEDIHQEFYDQDMRAYMVARSRYAEDTLERAVAAGVKQYVLLGAGLDTFAYRNPFVDVRVFEVDHHNVRKQSMPHDLRLLTWCNLPLDSNLSSDPVFEGQTQVPCHPLRP